MLHCHHSSEVHSKEIIQALAPLLGESLVPNLANEVSFFEWIVKQTIFDTIIAYSTLTPCGVLHLSSC